MALVGHTHFHLADSVVGESRRAKTLPVWNEGLIANVGSLVLGRVVSGDNHTAIVLDQTVVIFFVSQVEFDVFHCDVFFCLATLSAAAMSITISYIFSSLFPHKMRLFLTQEALLLVEH